MNYSEFRQYGYVSRLSEIKATGPGPGKNISTANAISGEQLGAASVAGQESAANYATFQKAIQPFMTQQTALASGDRNAALSAAMPVISQISGGYQGAKQQIMNSLPPGAARDTAIANLEQQKATGIGTAQANMVQQAPQNLANMGMQVGGMSLQQLGAQLAGFQGGAQTNMGAGQMAAQQQQSMLNFFGGLAKDVTGLIPGMNFGGGGGNSGGNAPGSVPDFTGMGW